MCRSVRELEKEYLDRKTFGVICFYYQKESTIDAVGAGVVEIPKKDWKLFRERVPDWQEHYMERLNREGAGVCSQEERK